MSEIDHTTDTPTVGEKILGSLNRQGGMSRTELFPSGATVYIPKKDGSITPGTVLTTTADKKDVVLVTVLHEDDGEIHIHRPCDLCDTQMGAMYHITNRQTHIAESYEQGIHTLKDLLTFPLSHDIQAKDEDGVLAKEAYIRSIRRIVGDIR